MDHAAAAARIHADRPVVDGHNDLPWAIWKASRGDLDAFDPAHHLRGFHTDIPRLFAGGVGAQFWSVYVPVQSRSPFLRTVEQIDLVKRMVERNPHTLELAVTAADVARIRGSGRLACLLGAEGGHAIENSVAGLRALHELGVRYMTLTHVDTIDWADSATDDPRNSGLSPFGVEIVREMNRLGMIVDISHVSAETMRDVLWASNAPIIASHSNAAALAPHPRNLPDDVLEGMAGNGGVVMVNFYPPFVVRASAVRTAALIPRYRRLGKQFGEDQQDELAEAERKLLGPEPLDLGRVGDVVDHIEHIARVAGIDHVGIGSDFDGMDLTPHGLEDVSCYPRITAELLRRGWSEEDVRQVLGGNILRVLDAVERVAAKPD